MASGEWAYRERVMAPIQRFEDIRAWQLARELTREVYALSNEGRFGRDYRYADRVRSASFSFSIMSNIAEGFGRDSLRECSQFLKVARGSCAEVRSLLYVAVDAGYVDDRLFEHLQSKAEEIGRVTAGLKAAVERRIGSTTTSVREDLGEGEGYRWDREDAATSTSSALGTPRSALLEDE